MNEHISALIDNEIDFDDARNVMNNLHSNQQAAQSWATYHLIGDVMRGENQVSANFKHQLMAKLDQEPTVLSPNALIEKSTKKVTNNSSSQSISKKTPAVWAIAASLAGVIAVSWVLLQTQLPNNSTQLASQTSVIKPIQMAQAEVPQALIETNNMVEASIPNEYLIAHQASAPTTNAYFIQAASYTK